MTEELIHDRISFRKFLNIKDEEKAICADSGYMSKERKKKLRKKGIFYGIVERRVPGQSKLRAKQSRNTKRFAKL